MFNLENTKKEIPFFECGGEKFLSTKNTSKYYGVTEVTIRGHLKLNKDELLEGEHWVKLEVQTNGGKQKVIHWTLEGVHMLGFFIKSQEAKKFRKEIATLISEVKRGNLKVVHDRENAIRRGYESALSKKDKVIAELKSKKLLPVADKNTFAPFEFNALLDVMGQGEKSIKKIEVAMNEFKFVLDRLYLGQPKYNIGGVER